MKKTIIVTLSLVALIITSLAFTISEPPGYKNLKILPNDISKEKLDSIMHNYTNSLNVKCTFCHVRNKEDRKWDFASDSIADKQITRKMMLMAMDINKKYFIEDEEGKHLAQAVQPVSCYTCHRGAEIPLTTPPPPPPRIEGQLQQTITEDKK